MQSTKLTVQAYCEILGWTVSDLQRRAGINMLTAKKAFEGEPVTARIQMQISAALGAALNQQINVGDILWAKPEATREENHA